MSRKKQLDIAAKMRILRPPRYLPEVLEAICELKEKRGSNAQRIIRHIEKKLKRSPLVSARNISMQVRRALKAVTESGVVQQTAGLFRLRRGGRDSSKRNQDPKDCAACRRKERERQRRKNKRKKSQGGSKRPMRKSDPGARTVKKSKSKPRGRQQKSYLTGLSDDDSPVDASRSPSSDSDDGRRDRRRRSLKHRRRHSKGRVSRREKKRKNDGRKRRGRQSVLSVPTYRGERSRQTARKTPYRGNKRRGRQIGRSNVDPFAPFGMAGRGRRRISKHHSPIRSEYTIDPRTLSDMNPTDCSTANEPNSSKASPRKEPNSNSGGGGANNNKADANKKGSVNNSKDPDNRKERGDKDQDVDQDQNQNHPDCGDPNCLCNVTNKTDKDKPSGGDNNSKKGSNA